MTPTGGGTQRIPGGGTFAVLRARGRPEHQAMIVDVSRGGVSVRSDWRDEAGMEVQVVLPGAAQPVAARVARAEGGLLALAFHQDAATVRQVDQALDHIAGRGKDGAESQGLLRRLERFHCEWNVGNNLSLRGAQRPKKNLRASSRVRSSGREIRFGAARLATTGSTR